MAAEDSSDSSWKLSPTLLGDHERVPGSQGADVEECEHMLILVHPMTGNFPIENTVEDRGFGAHGHGHSSVRAG